MSRSSFSPQKRLLVCLTLALTLSLTGARLFAVTASPDPVEVTQPGGAKLTLRVRGDEFVHWYEDSQGFTVVRDSAKQYVYANLDGAGRLAPTALAAGEINPNAAGLARGIQPTKAALETDRTLNLQARAEGAPQAGPDQVSPLGTVKNLVVLCKFADHGFATHTRPQADYDTLFNSTGGHPDIAPTGSVKDYFTEASYGVLNLQSTVIAWVTLPQTEAYYADGKDGTDGVYPKNAQGMVKDALDLVDPLVNFGQFDQDNDGFIDSITFIHSGYGAETGGGGGNWIWSHRWSLWAVPGGNWTSQDNNGSNAPVKVYDYHTEPALWGTSGTECVRIGVICHETGHFFGLPDLYDTDYSSSGIGAWCLMANSWGFDGSQLHPPHLSAWCKEQLGWVTPTVITAGTHSAPQVETNPTIYKITNGFPSDEYLLVENRQPSGFETAIPQGGLAVWHIDTRKPNNNDEGFPGQAGWPENNRHLRIALLQADGLYQLEKGLNRGDAGDLFRGGGVSAITPSTVPGTDRYQEGIVATSNNSITNISASGVAMNFTLNAVGGVPVITSPAMASTAPGVPFNYQIVATNAPASYGADGLPGGLTVNSSTGLISGTPPDQGVSTVILSATNASGTGTSTLTLTVAPILTLSDALDTTGMTWTTGGDSNWSAQTPTSHDGQDAARSGLLGDNQSSHMETTVTGPGTLTFWWKISSEPNYDFLRLFVDGVQESAITGTVDWQQRSVSLAAGSHTLRWQYTKDGSVASGSDAGWVDEVEFSGGVVPPVITSATTADGVAGQEFSYQILATGIPTTYGASGLPPLLTIDTASGLISGTPSAAGSFNITLSATNSAGPGTAPLVLTVSPPTLTLAEALEAPALPWTSAGSSQWQAQLVVTHDGQDAAQSGLIGHSQESWVETTLTGPGTLAYWWKVSSEENFDYLTFTVDGVVPAGIAALSGEVDWQQRSLTIESGMHVLRWRYSKDGSVNQASDAGWLDEVVFTPTAPEPEIAVEQPAGNGLTDGLSTVGFGSVASGSNGSRTFTIRNPGSLNLTVLGITLDGAHPGDFSVTSNPATSVIPGDNTTFTVQFTPTVIGVRTAALHIASDDLNENPFDIELTGTGVNPLTTFADDFDPDFDSSLWAQFGGTVVANTNGQLAGAGSTNNSLWFGGDGDRFALTLPLDTRGGGAVSFLVALADGDSISWENADPGEEVVLEYSTDGSNFVQFGGPYNNTTWQNFIVGIPAAAQTVATQFRYRQLDNSGSDFDHWAIEDVQIGAGTATAPEIALEQPAGNGLTDQFSTVDFGLIASGAIASRTFTIRNPGSADLTGFTISIDGENSGDFAVVASPAATVAPGGSTTFTVQTSPSASGVRIANLHLASNDADENPFDVALTCQVLPNHRFEFTNTAAITIPASGASGEASPYPSTINVSGVSGTVTSLRVKLNGFSHSWPDDVDVFLVSPSGQVCALISDAGGSNGVNNLNLAFDDSGTALSDVNQLDSGTYRPTDNAPGEPLPPGGSGTIGTNLLALAGGTVNGGWNLFVSDDFPAEDGGSISSWSLDFETAPAQEFTSVAGITIPSSGTAIPYPSGITVSGLTGTVTSLRVNLNGFSHTWPDDVDVFLVSPAGQVCALISDAGGSNDANNLNLVFDDTGPAAPDAAQINAATYRPTDHETGEPLPPGGSGTTGTNLLALAAGNANGEWNLYVSDDTGSDSGSISSWSLTFETAPSQEFSNLDGITIPFSGSAAPYPSIINVSGVSGNVTAMRVKLGGFTHTWPDDVDVFLVSPAGLVCAVISDAGGSENAGNLNLVFEDTKPAAPDGSLLGSATYGPTNYETGEPLPPGGSGTIGTNLLALTGGNANGTWKLFVSDDTGGDTGSITSWSVFFETENPSPAKILLVEDQGGFGNAAAVLAANGFDVTTLNNEFTNGYSSLLDESYLSQFGLVVYGERGSGLGSALPADVASSLESFIQSGGHVLVTGYDTLGSPTDPALATLVRALSPDDYANGEGGWQMAGLDHPILNGLYGDFRNLSFTAAGYDDDSFSPDTAAGAVALATVPSGQTRLLFTDLPGAAGSVGYWNGGISGTPTNAQPDFSDGGNPQSIFLNYVAYAVPAPGEADSPEIAVEQPAGTGLADNASMVDFGTVASGSSQSFDFTVHNQGTADLSGLGIAIDGANPGDFTVTVNPAAPVAPGGGTTFTVRFSPAEVGTRAASLRIASNDADENPFDIALTGTGTLPTGSTYSITASDRGWYNAVGTHNPDNLNYLTGNSFEEPESRSFFIFALPTLAPGEIVVSAELRLINPATGYSSPESTENLQIHEVVTPVGTLAAGTGDTTAFNDLGDGPLYGGPLSVSTADNATTLVVPLNSAFLAAVPSHSGSDIALGGILSTLSHLGEDESFFRYSNDALLTDTQLVLTTTLAENAPDISVEQPEGFDLVDGSSTVDFGPVTVTLIGNRSFTIRNLGATTLNLPGINIDGANSSAFFVSDSPASSVPPGGSTTFAVSILPSSLGTLTANLHIASNDPDENPFDISLTATGVTPLGYWYSVHFTSAELAIPDISGPTADPENDGIANLVEYVLDFDPQAHSPSPALGGIETIGPDRFQTLTFSVPEFFRTDATLVVLESAALESDAAWTTLASKTTSGPWISENGGVVSADPPLAGRIQITVRSPNAIGTANPHGFMRLRALVP